MSEMPIVSESPKGVRSLPQRRISSWPSARDLLRTAESLESFMRICREASLVPGPDPGDSQVSDLIEHLDVVSQLQGLASDLRAVTRLPFFGWSPTHDAELNRYLHYLNTSMGEIYSAWGIGTLHGAIGSFVLKAELGDGLYRRLIRQEFGPDLGEFVVPLRLSPLPTGCDSVLKLCQDNLVRIARSGPALTKGETFMADARWVERVSTREDAESQNHPGTVSVEPTPALKPHPGDSIEIVDHADDFCWVRCSLGTFKFTANQRPVIRALLSDWRKAGVGLSDSHLMSLAGSSSQIRHLFRGNDAWGTLIVSGANKGTRALKLAPAAQPPQ